jgi:hypothetical protein
MRFNPIRNEFAAVVVVISLCGDHGKLASREPCGHRQLHN